MKKGSIILIFLFVICLTNAQDAAKVQFMNLPWKMHQIDRQYWNPNSLSPGDVNGDGFDDYCVIHDGPDIATIIFNPGLNNQLYHEWEKVVIAKGSNVEYAYFGDLDGDGNLDMAVANGTESGGTSHVDIIWGPDKSLVKDSSKWVQGGTLPASKNQGQYVYLETYDINQDGALDIVAGGRRASGPTRKLTGIIWFEAPKRVKDRRDLSKWVMHSIDPDILSGHGFVFADINNDGNEDIVVANPDWDTPDNEDKVLWYENPGPHSEAIKDKWEKHVVHRNKELFAKAQVGIGDLNQDGKTDLVVQSDNKVFYLEQQENPDKWKVNKINKPEITRWVTRPIKVVDLDGNGRLDIVGATIHNNGYTPFGKASVFWMEYLGEKPGTDNWQTHVIKWSDGIFSSHPGRGEKWDHMRFLDLDRDGDLDIIANCEEYFERIGDERKTLLGVVWFENPTINP